MKYLSTRGGVSGIAFKDAVIMGLANDGGLLVPESLPDVSGRLHDWDGLPYSALAFEIMRLFIDDIADDDLKVLVERSYATFTDPGVTPVRTVGDTHILELFHGPTLAFKDVALQFLGNVFEHILTERNAEVNILGATSGDTGGAAIAGVRGKDNINIYIMFPEGKTSPLQELQMTTVLDDNVHNIAIKGSFDDCQTLMKDIFGDLAFKERYSLAAVNSVNWTRVLAQIVYYFSAWYQLGKPEVFDVAVPTGNFGNIFAGYCAKRMGLPIGNLILATNENNILCEFFNTGMYKRGDVHFTYSPAMDIQVSSNLERYLYYLMDTDTEKVRTFMESFKAQGKSEFRFNTPSLDESFKAGYADNEATLKTIRGMYERFGYVVDPHTAVGLDVAERFRREGVPLVCLATAHPAKFEEAMEKALPNVDTSHPQLNELVGKPARKEIMPADIAAVRHFIESGGAA